MATLDFDDGAGTDELSAWDSNFTKLGGADTSLTGSATATPDALDKSMYFYNEGQTGLDQSSKASIKPLEEAAGGWLCCSVSVHSSGAVAGIALRINAGATDIGTCSLWTMFSPSSWQWIRNIPNPDVTDGTSAFVDYEIIARDNGDGTIDVDVNIDGQPYPNMIENRAQTAGYPGMSLYRTGVIDTMETTPLVVDDTRTITFSNLTSTGGSNTSIVDRNSDPFSGDIDWTVYSGTDITALTKEDEGTDETVTNGAVTLSFDSALASGDPVVVSIIGSSSNRHVPIRTVID